MDNYAVCLSKPIKTAFISMKGMYVSGTGSTGSRAFPYFLADLAEYVIRFLTFDIPNKIKSKKSVEPLEPLLEGTIWVIFKNQPVVSSSWSLICESKNLMNSSLGPQTTFVLVPPIYPSPISKFFYKMFGIFWFFICGKGCKTWYFSLGILYSYYVASFFLYFKFCLGVWNKFDSFYSAKRNRT
jgi:hypothetical protein